MPLPLPNLDDRRWLELVEEGRALIPFYGPEWTDHNYHCPGITFLELFAWITEMDVYQVDRVPESHVRKFLALVGTRTAPPQAAHAVFWIELKARFATMVDALRIPSGFEFETAEKGGDKIRFRTVDTVTVLSEPLAAIQTEGREGFRDVTERWQRREPIPVFGDDPQPGTALYLGFEKALPQNMPITVYFQADKTPLRGRERERIISFERELREDCQAP